MGKLKRFLGRLGVKEIIINSFYPVRKAKLRGVYYKRKLKRSGWGITIDKFVNIQAPHNLVLGDFCVINSYVHIWAGDSGVNIGNRVLIASHVAITSLTHDYSTNNMRFSDAIDRPINIGDDVWIGAHAVIMPGVTIGRGSVIGAGSVITKDVPENAIVVGVPGRVQKNRFN